ncbi:MAG: peptide-methionine (R)-S-oxide reductase MsrB [Oligoflexia bacterium]|nr:peptide-methionine (R)-S-oxide reductase MsrB [Oligoflexia bacterium]
MSAQNSNADPKPLPAHLRDIDADKVDWRAKGEEYWKEVLSLEQFRVCRQADTERPFSGKYCYFKEQGTFRCACCGLPLFSSNNKFDSGTGWPSFNAAVSDGALKLREDRSHGMVRTEVLCGRCGAHLGHVFNDGPPPSHQRFCINSICLLHDAEK